MSVISSNEIVVSYKVVGQAELQKLAQQFEKVTESEKESLEEFRKLNSKVKDTTTSLGQNATAAKKAGAEATKSFKEADDSVNRFSSSLKGIGPLLTATFSVAAIAAFGKEVLRTTAQFQQYQKVLDFTSGSQKQGAISMQFLKETSDKLGISLIAAVEGYKTLSGAATQAGLSNNQTRKIFDNVAKSVAAFGLSADDAKGVFLALGQIISKGTVSAEELRGQIGERIPGAFSIAAKSIGKTEAELNKMLQTGQVTSRDFVIPFTKELAKAAAAADGPNGLTQNVNRISNAFEILKTRIGRGLLGPTGQVGSLLERALNAANKLLSTQSDDAAVLTTRAYEKATKDAEKATNEALKTSVTNANARVRAAKEEFDLINERIAIDGKVSDDEQKQIDRQRNLVLELQSYRDGLYDALKGRKETIVEIEKTQEELKKEYQLRISLLELEKKSRELRAIQNQDQSGALQAQKLFLDEKLKLDKAYFGKLDSITEDQLFVTEQEQKNATIAFNKAYEDALMDRYKIENESEEERQKRIAKRLEADSRDREKWMKENNATAEQFAQKEIDLEKFKERAKQEVRQQAADLAQDSINSLFSIRQAQLQNELTLVSRKFDEEVRLADGNAQKINEIEERRRAKEKEIAIKQFRAQQLQAVANAAFQAAPYIVKYSAGLPLTSANLALTIAALAAQTGFILAQPVPEFAKGVTDFKGGPAIVGEKGSELIETSKGSFLSPDKPTLTYLPKGTNVITATKTRERMQILNSSYKKGQDQFQTIDTSPIAAELAKMPVAINRFDERGFTEFVKKGNRTTQILNRRKGY